MQCTFSLKKIPKIEVRNAIHEQKTEQLRSSFQDIEFRIFPFFNEQFKTLSIFFRIFSPILSFTWKLLVKKGKKKSSFSCC